MPWWSGRSDESLKTKWKMTRRLWRWSEGRVKTKWNALLLWNDCLTWPHIPKQPPDGAEVTRDQAYWYRSSVTSNTQLVETSWSCSGSESKVRWKWILYRACQLIVERCHWFSTGFWNSTVARHAVAREALSFWRSGKHKMLSHLLQLIHCTEYYKQHGYPKRRRHKLWE